MLHCVGGYARSDQHDIITGAAIAGVSYNRFMRELEKRNIIILDDPHFLEELLSLSDTFDLPELRRAAEKTLGSTERQVNGPRGESIVRAST